MEMHGKEIRMCVSITKFLETPGISRTQEDEILGELSARLSHLEIHARDTQEQIDFSG